jgi:hypothetical protein
MKRNVEEMVKGGRSMKAIKKVVQASRLEKETEEITPKVKPSKIPKRRS